MHHCPPMDVSETVTFPSKIIGSSLFLDTFGWKKKAVDMFWRERKKEVKRLHRNLLKTKGGCNVRY